MRMLGVLTVGLLLSVAAQAADPVAYSLPDMNGKTHSLQEYRGKWVIVNFWATWCPPCQDEIPDLVDFHDRHQDKDAVVVGINFEDIGQEQLQSFVDSFLISYPVLRSQPSASTPLGPITGLPTTFIIAPDGSAVARQVGPVTARQLEDFIARKQQAYRDGAS